MANDKTITKILLDGDTYDIVVPHLEIGLNEVK